MIALKSMSSATIVINAKLQVALFITTLLFGGAHWTSYAETRITATIKPLQFIALAIVGDAGEVTSLIDGSDSPHHFVLSPSDRVAIANSDLIVWIGPEFETVLADSMASLSVTSELVTATQINQMKLFTLSDGETLDTHLWLNTSNALIIAEEILSKLTKLDPQNASIYQTNYRRFAAEMSTLNDEIKSSMTGLANRNFMVYHNAFQYFQRQYGLEHQVEMVLDPEVDPGIKQILAVRQNIKTLAPICLLKEPNANEDLIKTLLKDSGIHEQAIDLLGTRIQAEPNAYGLLINQVASGFKQCLDRDK